LIGPSRQFGAGSIYNPQLYALAFGVVLPLPFWLWQRKFPNTKLKYVNIPVLLNGIGFIPPATGINYSSWFATGFVFQYLIRKKNFAWWSKFNYVMSAGLDCGTLVSILIIFFCLQVCLHFTALVKFETDAMIQWPRGGVSLNWWGNTVAGNSMFSLVSSIRDI
jgi:hypothetical protein